MDLIAWANWQFGGGDVWSKSSMISCSLVGVLLIVLTLRYTRLLLAIMNGALFSKQHTGSFEWVENAKNEYRRDQKIRSGYYDSDEY